MIEIFGHKIYRNGFSLTREKYCDIKKKLSLLMSQVCRGFQLKRINDRMAFSIILELKSVCFPHEDVIDG